MKKITFVTDEGGDWLGVYFGDKLAMEGHSLSARDLCDALDLEVEHIEIPSWEKYGNRCPDILPEDMNEA
jgi:hypothetical protein